MSGRWPRIAAALIAFAVVLFGAVPTAQASNSPDDRGLDDWAAANAGGSYGWVGSWMTAADRPGREGPAAAGFRNQTLRQVIDLSLGGDRIRVRLSNVFGERALRVGAATVAPRLGVAGAATVGHPLRLTFRGSAATTVPAGAEVFSDPIALPVDDGTHLVVSLYLPEPTGPATWHRRGWTTTYLAAGDASGEVRMNRYTKLGPSFFFLAGVDVLTRSAGAVLAFGDSITEGCCESGSIDADISYPDRLAGLTRGSSPRTAVLNAGISGNALLTDGAGVSALSRFERDALSQTKVRTVILLEGINDIIRSRGSVHAGQLIRAQAELVRQARAKGLRVIGATLTPFGGSGGYTAAGERDRRALNRWIRSSDVFDAVVDFDRVLRDPANPSRLRRDVDPGDHLHPNATGYAAMAAAIDLSALDRPPEDRRSDVTVITVVDTYLRDEEYLTMFGDHLAASLLVQLPD